MDSLLCLELGMAPSACGTLPGIGTRVGSEAATDHMDIVVLVTSCNVGANQNFEDV